MMHKRAILPFELKKVDEKTGSFSGYAAIFGNVDQGYDVILPGAFKEIVTNANGGVTVLWQHDYCQPIASAQVTQDDKGLHFDGQLVLDDPLARVALAHMKAGTVTSFSIGYDVLEGGASYDGEVRKLSALKLWEFSLVTWAMNPLAQLESVKQSQNIHSRADFEKFLHAAGFSHNQARKIALQGFHPGGAPTIDEKDASWLNDFNARIERLGAAFNS
jgi:HK97 family phage prohead protease